MPVAGTLALLAALLTPQQPVSNDAAAGLSGASPAGAARSATAVRAEHPPVIDGRDDDPVWRGAPRYSAFRTFEPTVDKDPRFATEFRVAYDAKNLYVFTRMFDPHPDSIMRALSRRDNRGPSDQIKIIVDSYHDRRSGYQFAVNPDGSESIVPFDVRDEFVVIHGVFAQLRLRRGREVLCVFNEAPDFYGRDPKTGTASSIVERTPIQGDGERR